MISSVLIIIICSLVNLSIIKFSYKIGLVDMPSIRKIHKGPVAFTGGLILAINFFIIILLIDYENKILNNVIYFSIVLAVLGIVDDKYIIKPILKLILQLFPICLVIYFGVFLEDLGNYKYFDKINQP